MSLQLTLRVGDTTAQDISLTLSGVTVLDYPMAPPTVDQALLEGLGDGNNLGVPSWSNVTESIEIRIALTTAALVADRVRAIELLCDLARQGTTGWLDENLYIIARFDQDTEDWRSQILAARFVPTAITDQIWRNYVHGTLIITRRFYWETAAVKAIALTSGTTTTATTGYATVHNADDTSATARNWFQMAADQVTGSIPAPATIYIKNNTGATRAAATVYLGNYVYANPTTVDPIFRAEDATGSTTTPGTFETDVYYWSLADGNLTDAFKGQFGRVIAVFSDRPASTTLMRAALQYRAPAPVFDIALGEQLLHGGGDFVSDLGGIPIPPGGFWANAGSTLYLAIKAKALSGTDTVAVDWVQVFPSGAGRYRVLKSITGSLTLSNTNEIIDNGNRNAAYLRVTATTDDLPLYKPLFTPIYLWPDKINRLRMVISGGSSFEAGQAWSVKMTYQPRRLTV